MIKRKVFQNSGFAERISQSYINKSNFKGQVYSRLIDNITDYYANTSSEGKTFKTFKQADKFMKSLGYEVDLNNNT